MAEYEYYDLLDEINCADNCEAVTYLCELVDKLITDIQFLELECISTRYLLSRQMNHEDGEMLRMDILDNLARRHSGDPAYELYKTLMYSGGDPMEFHDYHVKVQEVINGKWPCWH